MPHRDDFEQEGGSIQTTAGAWQTVVLLLKNPATCLIIIAEAINQVSISASIAWIPTFLKRVHGFDQTQVAGLAVVGASATIVGTVLIAIVAAHLATRRAAWMAWVPALILVLIRPFAATFLLTQSMPVAIFCYLVMSSAAVATYPPTIALLHANVDARQRHVASAVIMGVVTIVGPGIGPGLIGFLNDGFLGDDPYGIRYALLALQTFPLVAAILYVAAGVNLNSRLSKSLSASA